MSKSSLTVIAQRYAQALMGIGEDNNTLDVFKENLLAVKKVFEENKDLDLFLNHPTIPVGEKKSLIDEILKDKISAFILNIIKILLDKNRFFLYGSIVNNYISLLNEKRNISTAKIITAIEISEEIKNKVKEKLEKVFEVNVEVETAVNPEIIAGMVVKMQDKVIDGSIKTKIENMQRQVI